MMSFAIQARLQPPVKGRMSFTATPVRKAVRMIYRRIQRVISFIIPPWRPSFGKIGSSFSIPVVNPLRGPPAEPKAALPAVTP